MPNHSDYAISVDNLVKKFGARAAVNKISFKVAKGTIFGLLGSNGAGKSTT
jgi:ABC-type multidrug transport system ATPase subunit